MAMTGSSHLNASAYGRLVYLPVEAFSCGVDVASEVLLGARCCDNAGAERFNSVGMALRGIACFIKATRSARCWSGGSFALVLPPRGRPFSNTQVVG